MCVILSDSSAHCCFSAPHCFSGELIAPSKAGVALVGVPVTLRLWGNLTWILVCAALPNLASLTTSGAEPQLVPLTTFLEFHFGAALGL